MAVSPIVVYGHPALRGKARAIETIDESVRKLARDMIETMEAAEGIGLAAPQVGETVAMCVVDHGMIEEGEAPRAYLNPVIVEDGSETSTLEEGCLSIPDIREDVTRPEAIRFQYMTLDGVSHEEEIDGMLARVLQHEIDHLNGVLFVDRISPLKRKLLSNRLKKMGLENPSLQYLPGPEE